ncbi:hypothetical protein Pmar_PMAR011723 [Perkinsus marinus ATCC 50983]|uniref:Uncharacterized protein n=1 Tax=Perkinsus marinus (strain ATCC 50983 / TXsc) TaxID=423536 RepID=C5LCJ4_PERM5|nr:hypothetical protein Pmar_PMAR011723 [Perkinsus marinus ATCC 50983]EER05677.1 hypothetical protein Pmar_PMAR011723 [Perkinsus marinus ATCC 50983]|eukprot:XP_002773861.1 hypothetical protein Pmar_PMAR011723 [Perkinsus marinus ATCC 50983]
MNDLISPFKPKPSRGAIEQLWNNTGQQQTSVGMVNYVKRTFGMFEGEVVEVGDFAGYDLMRFMNSRVSEARTKVVRNDINALLK